MVWVLGEFSASAQGQLDSRYAAVQIFQRLKLTNWKRQQRGAVCAQSMKGDRMYQPFAVRFRESQRSRASFHAYLQQARCFAKRIGRNGRLVQMVTISKP